jgi:alpha-tubulin suppressor-like RCC1 family protein
MTTELMLLPAAGGTGAVGFDLYQWGQNTWGAVGDGSATNHVVPQEIGSDTDWAQVAAGGFHSLAVRNNGTLWAWGRMVAPVG